MKVRELAVPGAWELTPTVHGDSRGAFFEWFTDTSFTAMTGHSLDLRQANCSVSSAGVLRGLHFAQLPPSQAKYVTCMRGAVVDVIVDIRVGSPTYGSWDAVTLDDETHRAVYLSEGLGHAFLALQDNSIVTYLCSAGYDPAREHTIDPLDPEIGIDWAAWFPTDGLVLSDRDRAAPSLADMRDRGMLPTWEECLKFAQTQRG
ncbi:MAG: dTDP-4-dehydrorhamnose 3,5-epimerase [Mycobacterium kyogaense]|uniref:dTDP-4-dehydrorhamnose 3,5-epimerase family protein n=1 Tax=Mycobacterium kyogaense TaxID=2212479 RepID=UPI002FF9AAD5